MTLSEQAAVVLEAINDELLQPEDIVRWADTLVVATEHPPGWLIDISTLPSPRLRDIHPILREHAPSPLTLRQQIQVVALAYEDGLLSLRAALSHLFRVAILDRGHRPLDGLGDNLVEALVEWDCQEDLDTIEPPLTAKFEAIFCEYLHDAHDLSALVPWRLQKAEPCAPPNGGPATRLDNSGVTEGPPSVS